MSSRTNLICALVIGSLAACGGGGGNSSTNAAASAAAGAASAVASSAAGAASNAAGAMSSAAGAAGAAAGGLANKVAAAIPSSLHCGAVPPVWVNSKTHVYHEPSDPLYGKTKAGQYMCASAAVAAGYHKAGGGKWKGAHMKGHRHHRMMKGGMGTPAPAST